MKTEYEAKFLSINKEDLLNKLKDNGGKLISPMRTMKRIVIDTPELKKRDAFLRVRDEGDKITLTYKQFNATSVDGAKELEVTVGDFDTTVSILKAMDLHHKSFQESRRETWKIGEAEVVIDEWPWLNPYVEIEGPSEEVVKEVATALGFLWENAAFGDVMTAYRNQYPNIPVGLSVGDIKEVRFDAEIPGSFH